MYRIVGGRGSGKTYKLLEIANNSQGIIICSNPLAMREKARAWGFTEIKDFLAYQETESIQVDHKNVFIDEIEKYIKLQFSDNRLKGYTYTFEDESF